MLELIFAVALVAGLGALFGGLKGARIAVGLVIVLIVLAVAGIFGYAEYNDHQRTERQKAEVQRQAEQEKAEAQQQAAALSKTCREWEAKHPLGGPLDSSDNSNVVGLPKGAILGAEIGCNGSLEDAYNVKIAEYGRQYKAREKAKVEAAAKAKAEEKDAEDAAAEFDRERDAAAAARVEQWRRNKAKEEAKEEETAQAVARQRQQEAYEQARENAKVTTDAKHVYCHGESIGYLYSDGNGHPIVSPRPIQFGRSGGSDSRTFDSWDSMLAVMSNICFSIHQ